MIYRFPKLNYHIRHSKSVGQNSPMTTSYKMSCLFVESRYRVVFYNGSNGAQDHVKPSLKAYSKFVENFDQHMNFYVHVHNSCRKYHPVIVFVYRALPYDHKKGNSI